MTPTTIVDFREMLRCAKRELAMRQRVYPHLELTGKMTETEANRETNAQKMIVDYLEQIINSRQPELPLAERDGA